MSLEVELKLLLAPQQAPEVFSQILRYCKDHLPEVKLQQEKTLLNAYFDTADRWFRLRDSGLRTRQKHGQFEQTLKLAGQQHGAAHIRPEYNVPANGVVPQLAAFPAEVWPVGTDVTALQARLTELFRTDFVRQTVYLQTQTGTQIELVFDRGQVSGGGQQEDICELELELQAGAVTDLFDLAAKLLQQFPLQLGVQSKAERGYLLAQQQQLQWQDFTPSDQHADFLAKFLRNQVWAARQQGNEHRLWLQWQQWLALLAQAPAATGLYQSGQALGAEPATGALQNWLLQYSIWLLDPAMVQLTLSQA